MRYRELDPNGDFVFRGSSPFLVNSPACVAQAVLTRMRLYVREWFLDLRVGLDKERILGYGTQMTRDREIQRRIMLTQGVTALVSYNSQVDGRAFTVSATIDTVYGQTNITETF